MRKFLPFRHLSRILLVLLPLLMICTYITPSLAARVGADTVQRSAGKQRMARRRMPVSSGLSGASRCIGGIRLT